MLRDASNGNVGMVHQRQGLLLGHVNRAPATFTHSFQQFIAADHLIRDFDRTKLRYYSGWLKEITRLVVGLDERFKLLKKFRMALASLGQEPGALRPSLLLHRLPEQFNPKSFKFLRSPRRPSVSDALSSW
ncbi:MAG TPA: hypothetical protein P5186_28760 [Candidatus Paceibacterota bacterium]|nr:hypothetical protein [Verrucomicrobiota bacterium]HRY52040.1 hypothetical protein [Candidatus Paceibacterota bacterium]HSA01717.1 hypothetical protein [Candidatus Paceibacterota bacterium]